MARARLLTTLVGLALCLGCLSGAAMADDTRQNATPPANFKLRELTLSAERQPGNAAAKAQRASLSGAGKAMLEKDGASASRNLPPGELMPLVNELFALRFFDLPEDLNVQHSAVLKDDGTVMQRVLRLHDAANESLCFEAGGFRKCVRFSPKTRPELSALVRRVFEAAGAGR